ncbi:MAG: pseudouridine-5'-phosphate glycosidase [Clostridiales bacterium]|nr:pseudouridine-5'-phosphate glycosidase [Clostridiales bacterium]
MKLNDNILYSKEVAEAIENGRPVIALESTIISHGMPYPQNVETAKECERIAREEGAVPATCAILGGKLCVGLDPEQLEYLGKAGSKVTKASRRDIAVIAARGGDGALTVAGTMILAHMAGIKVFATGGIGGVHRGATETMDISADLEELGRTSVAVVCAGAKSILDIGLTLEYLETKGVPVIGFGTNEMPAFYTRSSGFNTDYRMDSPEEIAKALDAKLRLGIKGGTLIVNPVPEEYSMDKSRIDAVIEAAVKKANDLGVKGKNITPFLLAEIKDVTGGESLDTNIALVYNNVRLAASIAGAMKQ